MTWKTKGLSMNSSDLFLKGRTFVVQFSLANLRLGHAKGDYSVTYSRDTDLLKISISPSPITILTTVTIWVHWRSVKFKIR